MQPEEYEQLDDKEKVGAEAPESADGGNRTAGEAAHDSTRASGASNGAAGKYDTPSGDAKFSAKAASARAEAERLAERIGASNTPDGQNPGGWGQSVIGKFMKRRATYLIAVGVGGLIASLLALLFAFLPHFKLSFMKENVDRVRMARLMYILDSRSDRFLVTMMKAEVAGEQDGKNRYFEAKGWYDSPHPFTQWYRDMRTDKFFKDMAEKQGIRFAQETRGVGQSRLVRMTAVDVNGRVIDFSDLRLDGGASGNDLVDFERLVEERFDSNKSARRAFNAAVKEQTKSWQVIKRYNMRRWGYERLGITKWRFFEGTREKADNAVKDRWTKVVSRPILTGRFGKCIFGTPNDCPRTSNPNDEQNSFGSDSVDGDLEDALDESTEEQRAGDADDPPDPRDRTSGKLSKIFASKVVQKAIPVIDVAGYVEVAKQINYLLGKEDQGLVKLVAVMRAAEYASAYFALGTVTDHLKEGDKVAGEEVNAVMKMTEGIEKSDAYTNIAGVQNPSLFNAKVYAQENSEQDDYDEVTDMMKVNSEGSRAADISEYYQGSIGPVAGKFFEHYNGSLFDKVISAVVGLIDSLVGELVNAGKWVFGKLTGVDVDKLFESFIAKLMEFLGGAPICAAAEGGGRLLNCSDGGASVVAEALTQTMGAGPLSEKQVYRLHQDAALARMEDEKLLSPFERIASLDNPNSLFARVVVMTPTSYEGFSDQVSSVVASLSGMGLGNFVASTPNLFSRITGGPAYAQSENINPYGVKPYGLTEAELDSEPYDSQSQAQCDEEIREFEEAMKRGEDPPSSLCLFDRETANSLSCMGSDDEDCAKVDGLEGPSIVDSENGDISGDLPDGSIKELAQAILDNDKIQLTPGRAQLDIQNTARNGAPINKKLLQLILGLGNAGIEVNIYTMDTGHLPGSLHEQGKAMDISGVGGQMITSYDISLDSVKDFYDFMLKHNKSGEFGVPNQEILDYVKQKGASDAFIDIGTGPHIHIGVNN